LKNSLKLTDLALILASGRPAILLIKQTVLKDAALTTESYDGAHYVVAVSLDAGQIYIHDPLRKDDSGKAQAVPMLVLYQAWSQGQGYQRGALVPRTQLIRRVRVTAAILNVREQPNANSPLAGTVKAGEVYEVTAQSAGWGQIGQGRWISLSYATDI
jgi:uncharacterized protein YgiM (DUF1202 family)